MGIFDTIFGGNNNSQQQNTQQQTQQQPTPGPAEPGAIPPGTDPNAQPPGNKAPVQEPPKTEEPKGPLDEWQKLWETKPNTDTEGKPNSFALDPKDVQKAVSGMNFSSAISPEAMTAISAGGEDAQKAFAAALNNVAQQVMTQSTLVNNQLAEKAMKAALEQQAAQIPDLVRAQQVANHNVETNPVFNNPAVKPVVEATQSRLMQQFPNASNAEITKMTQDFITEMGKAFAPQEPTNTNSESGEMDWEKYFQS